MPLTSITELSGSGSYAFARQPILNQHQELVAYELLYRDQSGDNHAVIQHPVLATAQVWVASMFDQSSTLFDSGLMIYLNVPESALDWVEDWICPKEQVVIELLENIPATEKNLARIARLKKQGFRIALDDFCLQETNRAFLPYADIIKLDLMAASREELLSWLPELKQTGATLLAEKVESHDDWLWCKAQGFDLFQGYFFARPERISGRTICSSHLQVFQLISRLNDPHVSLEELEGVIKSDPSLYYRLMRYASHLCLKKEVRITSVRQAIMMTGLVRLKAFLMLISVTRATDSSQAAITYMFIITHMVESMAGDYSELATDTAFFIAAILCVATALGRSPQQLIAELKLSDELQVALADPDDERQVNYQSLVTCALKFSRQECDHCSACNISPRRVQWHYEQALKRSDNLIHLISTDDTPVKACI